MSAAPSIDEHLASVSVAERAGLERIVAPLVRSYLKETREHLTTLHEESRSGRLVNEANSDLIDRLVRRLFSLAEQSLLADGGEIEEGLCIVAVGGYARREMSIYSDVDLLVLYRSTLTPYVAAIAERLQYWLWDAGLTVGCATRTIAETVNLGREDVTVRTAVLMARFLCGDGEFFHEFSEAIRGELLPDLSAFIAEQRAAMYERHSRFGASLFLLQPNVKEGAGALRDYHTAYWVARAVQPSIRDSDDLLHFGLLTEPEMRVFNDALDFLWRLRNALHLAAGRRDDQMSFEQQEGVAASFGYGDSGQDGELAVERFMRDYYRHAGAIRNFCELIIEQCNARVSGASERRQVVEVEDGFRLGGHQLEIPHAAHLREKPLRLLGVFEVAQSHGVPLSRMARRFVRENIHLVDEVLRRDPEATATLLRILDSEQRVMRTLMVMNQVGLLGAFLPEWEHIVNRWQHVIYHTYTVDVHSIFLVEELRRLWRGKYEKALPELTELMREVTDRASLFLGCLLHDVGKGFGGNDHSQIGAERARACVDRLGLDQERADRVLFIVKHHLLMSHLAQRRDLSDPKLILEFARVCGDRENLRNLYLATFADIRASSRDAWNDWKGQLLRELFERCSELLETGADDRERAMELIEARVEVRRERSAAVLREQGVGEGKIHSFFQEMPRRYFMSHTPRQIARHAQVVLRYSGDPILATSFRSMRGGFTEFILCVRDRHGLYGMVTGTLTACDLNILGSHVYTLRSGIALEVYRLTTPDGGREELEMAWQELEVSLQRVLEGEVEVADLLSRRRRPMGVKKLPSQRPPSVWISNEESDFYTICDVTTDDRIGLLYDLARIIARHDLEIYISKAATILDQVADTFYLKDHAGKKLRDGEVIETLRADLLAVASETEADGA